LETQACEDPQGSHSEAQVQQRLADFRDLDEESRISPVELAEDFHLIEQAEHEAKEPEALKRRVESQQEPIVWQQARSLLVRTGNRWKPALIPSPSFRLL
jgi:hypothetical protein